MDGSILRNIEGHAMAESFTRQPLVAEACTRSKASLCGIYVGFVVGKTALRLVCIQALRFCLNTDDPHSFTHLSHTR